MYAHKLAKLFMKTGKPVNVKIINDILAFANIKINDKILNQLVNSPRIDISNLTDKQLIESLWKKIGSPTGKIETRPHPGRPLLFFFLIRGGPGAGVYIFINK
nr:hypothetical protein [Grifola frondosa]